jgi:hypothetical protein
MRILAALGQNNGKFQPLGHYVRVYTVEPGYNDIGLYDTSSITSDILWYQLIRHC